MWPTNGSYWVLPWTNRNPSKMILVIINRQDRRCRWTGSSLILFKFIFFKAKSLIYHTPPGPHSPDTTPSSRPLPFQMVLFLILFQWEACYTFSSLGLACIMPIMQISGPSPSPLPSLWVIFLFSLYSLLLVLNFVISCTLFVANEESDFAWFSHASIYWCQFYSISIYNLSLRIGCIRLNRWIWLHPLHLKDISISFLPH